MVMILCLYKKLILQQNLSVQFYCILQQLSSSFLINQSNNFEDNNDEDDRNIEEIREAKRQ